MTIEEKPKPCPFCGFPGKIVFLGSCRRAQCSNELCLSFICVRIEEWNTRASDEKLQKCLEFIKCVAKSKPDVFSQQDKVNLLCEFMLDALVLLKDLGEIVGELE